MSAETKRDFIAEAITEAFGERCPDADPNCLCCETWLQYDALKADLDELDFLSSEGGTWEEQLSAASSRISALEAALKPFAMVAKKLDISGIDWGDDYAPLGVPPLKAFRAARSLLPGSKEGANG